jgi:hypothetical protein
MYDIREQSYDQLLRTSLHNSDGVGMMSPILTYLAFLVLSVGIIGAVSTWNLFEVLELKEREKDRRLREEIMAVHEEPSLTPDQPHVALDLRARADAVRIYEGNSDWTCKTCGTTFSREEWTKEEEEDFHKLRTTERNSPTQ